MDIDADIYNCVGICETILLYICDKNTVLFQGTGTHAFRTNTFCIYTKLPTCFQKMFRARHGLSEYWFHIFNLNNPTASQRNKWNIYIKVFIQSKTLFDGLTT